MSYDALPFIAMITTIAANVLMLAEAMAKAYSRVKARRRAVAKKPHAISRAKNAGRMCPAMRDRDGVLMVFTGAQKFPPALRPSPASAARCPQTRTASGVLVAFTPLRGKPGAN